MGSSGVDAGSPTECSIAATLSMEADTACGVDTCNDVDDAIEGLTAKDAGGGSVKNLDALYVCNGYREIGAEVTGLGVVDVDAVEKKC